MQWVKNIWTGNYSCTYKDKPIHRLAGKGPRLFYYIQESGEHDKVFASFESAKKYIDSAVLGCLKEKPRTEARGSTRKEVAPEWRWRDVADGE